MRKCKFQFVELRKSEVVEDLIMKVIFVRHGKDDNKYRGGWSKIDLIPEGIEQAKQLANHMKENSQEYHIQRIIASDGSIPKFV